MHITEGLEIFLIAPEGDWTSERILTAVKKDPNGIIYDFLEVIFHAVSNPDNRDEAFLAQSPKCSRAWIEAAIKHFHHADPLIIGSDILSIGNQGE